MIASALASAGRRAAAADRKGSIAPGALAWRGAALGLLAVQIVLAIDHVPWRDEWQAFQIARHSRSLAALLDNLSYEGHPALWYVLLRAATAVWNSPATLSLVQASVAAASLCLLLFRAPFPHIYRLAAGASYLLLFEYGTIARSYGLGVLLTFAFLACRGRAWAGWLCLGLMANVSVSFLLLSAALAGAVVLIQEQRIAPWAGLWLGGCFAAVLTAWPAADSVPAYVLEPNLGVRLARACLDLAAILVPFNPFAWPIPWPVHVHDPGSSLIGAALPVVLWFALRRHPPLAWLGLALFAAVLGMSVFVYPASARHVGVIFLFVLAAEWMLADQRPAEAPSRATGTWLGVSAGFGLLMAANALLTPFVPGRQVAEFVRERGLADKVWTSIPAVEGVTLAAATDRGYYDLEQRCLTHFQRWNEAAAVRLGPDETRQRVLEAAGRAGGRLHVLTEPGRLPPDLPGAAMLGSAPPGLHGWGKELWVVDAAPIAEGLPFCVWSATEP